MILMLDNYDSFTYNLVQYLGELGAEVSVFRNDEISIGEIEALKPSHIVISPGPCTPNEAGITLELIGRQRPAGPQGHHVGTLGHPRINLERQVQCFRENRIDERQQRHLFGRHADRFA